MILWRVRLGFVSDENDTMLELGWLIEALHTCIYCMIRKTVWMLQWLSTILTLDGGNGKETRDQYVREAVVGRFASATGM